MSDKTTAGIFGLISGGIANLVDRQVCPGCAGTLRHRPTCELKALSINEAATLGLEGAREIAAERRKG
jgi:hypothetical protein